MERTLEEPLSEIDAQYIVNALTKTGRQSRKSHFECGPTGAWNVAPLRIRGQLDLTSVRYFLPLTLNGCTFDEEILAVDAHIGALDLRDCKFPGLTAKGIRIDGDLDLSRSDSSRAIDLRGAEVRGDFIAKGASFDGGGASSLFLANANVVGDVDLGVWGNRRCTATGEVRLLGVTIGGDLILTGAQLNGKTEVALEFGKATILGDVLLNRTHEHRFEAFGSVRSLGSEIGGSVIATGARLDGAGGDALSLDGTEVAGHVHLKAAAADQRFEAVGEVRWGGASVGGNFDLSGAYVDGRGNLALSFDGVRIDGNVYLTPVGQSCFEAIGVTSFVGALLGGQLIANGASFSNPSGKALDLYDATVTGTALLGQGARYHGGLDLRSASLSTIVDDPESWPAPGHLQIDGLTYTHFVDGPLSALKRLEWIRRQRPADWSGDAILSQPFFQLARVLTNMGRVSDAKTVLFELESRVHAAKATEEAFFSLCIFATGIVLTLLDGSLWPALVAVIGLTILDMSVAFQNRREKASFVLPAFGMLRLFVGWLLYLSAGYGYRPYRAFPCLIAIFLMGALIFDLADHRGGMLPVSGKDDVSGAGISCVTRGASDKSGCPRFNAFLYSFSVLIPATNTRQTSYWQPIGAPTYRYVQEMP